MLIPVWPELLFVIFVLSVIFYFCVLRNGLLNKIFFLFMRKNNSQIILALAFLCVLIFLAASFIAPNFLTVYPLDKGPSANTATTINGLMSPFIAIAAAILTFMAFWVQFQANNVLKHDALKKDVTDKFFEMLRMYNENIKQLDFSCYLDEFASIFKIYRLVNEIPPQKIYDAIVVSYKIFFWGISNDDVCDIPERDILMNLTNPFYSFMFDLRNPKYKHLNHIQNHRNDFAPSKTTVDFIGEEDLFRGRKKTLVRYYRHLYLMVKYVAHNKNLNYSEKRELLRFLRAQMSGEEQLMLFFNWASGIGVQWEETKNQQKNSGKNNVKYNHFFTEFRVIHNIIPEQLDFIWSDSIEGNAAEFVKLIKEICPASSLPPNTPSDVEKNDVDTIFEFEDWVNRNTYFCYDKKN